MSDASRVESSIGLLNFTLNGTACRLVGEAVPFEISAVSRWPSACACGAAALQPARRAADRISVAASGSRLRDAAIGVLAAGADASFPPPPPGPDPEPFPIGSGVRPRLAAPPFAPARVALPRGGSAAPRPLPPRALMPGPASPDSPPSGMRARRSAGR